MADATVSPLERYFYNEEAEEIGGLISLLLANQGAGKTVGLSIKAGVDFNQDRIVYWRGQDTCQWVLMAANGLPITLWVHDTITKFDPYITGDIRSGDTKDRIDLETASDVSVKVTRFSDVEELVENPDTNRVNVFYFPGGRSHSQNERYFFYRKHVDLAAALNRRSWGNHVSFLMDEVGDVLTTEKRKPFYALTEFKLPEEFGQFRKNNISMMATGHDTSDIHYKFWKVKANTIIYMRGAKVKKSMHSNIDQDIVNGFDRGEFVIPGFQKDHFEIPAMPHETITWMPEGSSRKLRIDIEADVPDIMPKDTAAEALEDSPLDKDDLLEIVGTTEAADILDVSPQAVRQRIDHGTLPAIKPGSTWIMPRSALDE
jgi:excisionase family DNA binding protein